ncbi:MAG TPA: helix-turn-helix transcriptional regulator [Gammaproteobacteria bacterium]|nr:helix-turn-helix transcriptional regulator [Gammaproteobacteria bacterium]
MASIEMTTALSNMIEQTSIKHDKLLKKITEPLHRHLGIDYFCYQFVSNEGRWFTLGNRPAWLLHSAESKFYQCDPSLANPHYVEAGVCFPEHHQNGDFQVMREVAIATFDLDHALAIIEPNQHGCEYYFFAAPKAHNKVINYYLKYLTQLRGDYTRYVKEKMQPFYEHFLSNTVNLQALNPKGFHANHNVLLADEALSGDSFLRDIQCRDALTERERECLLLFKQGYTAKESAIMLGISYRTIEKHFEAIKRKLGVHHKRYFLK